MLRISAILAAAMCAAAVAATASQADHGKDKGKGSHPFPAVIQLPIGFQPEGIEIGRGTTFYVGSVATGAIFRGDLRTGAGGVFVSPSPAAVRPVSSTTTTASSSRAQRRGLRTSTTREVERC